jgi:tetratricopeptide (TPR) repeat protein
MKFFARLNSTSGSSRGRLSTLLGLALALFLWPSVLTAGAPDEDLDAANRAYTYGSYDEAAKLFLQVIAARGYSASLCFDLANAEARAGHPGLAILNYERARYLAPGDRDIDHNLQLARKQAGLEPNSYRWWQVALRSVNWMVWLSIMAACLVLIFLAIVGTAFAPGLAATTRIPLRTLKNIFRTLIFACIPIALFLGFIELSTIGFDNRIEGVIVAPKEATLRLSPFDSAESTGTIPEGELVTVEDRHDDYLRIEARDHHFGWVQAKDLAPVIAGSFDVKPE